MFGLMSSCNSNSSSEITTTDSTRIDTTGATYDPNFNVEAQSFADLKILRYQVPGFNQLSLREKQLAYYLSEAALAGRDIFYDQKSKYGLTLRKTLEAMYGTYTGDKSSDDWKKFEEYCGRFWFSYGTHHHYSNEKFLPEYPAEYFEKVIKASDTHFVS